MRLNTLATLGGATLFGVAAVWLAKGWINDAIESEFNQVRPAKMVTETRTPTFPVVIAVTDIPFGETITPDMVELINVPEKALPFGAFENLDTLQLDQSAPTVALTQISASEIILDHRISGPGGRGSLSAIISPGMRATSIRVSTVTGVGGFIVPGDRVDVLLVQNTSEDRQELDLKADLLLQNVKVLGIDQNLNDRTDNPAPAETVTLEVTFEAAQKLKLAQDMGTLTLSLRRMGEDAPLDADTIFAKTMLNSSTSLTPRKTTRRTNFVKPQPRPTGAEVTVVRGEDREPVMVFRDRGESEFAELAGGAE